jgi:D-alanine-D-alanine ligase
MKRLRVGVVYGGRSSEHEVSLASAAAVFANLDPARYDAVPIYIQRDGRWSLADRPPTMVSAGDVIEQQRSGVVERRSAKRTRDVHFAAYPSDETLITIQREPHGPTESTQAVVSGLTVDVVFPVIHGPYGEDGTLQGLLELADVPYVGAGVLSSAVGMDKAMAKVVFAADDLPVVEYAVVLASEWQVRRRDVLGELAGRFEFPVFVKPANLGSSIGISKAGDPDALERAIDLAYRFDRKVIVEIAVPAAREFECAVLGNDTAVASIPGEIVSSGEFYDYDAKYVDTGSTPVIPADLSPEETARIRSMAVKAFRAIDGAGMARVDFLFDGATEKLYVNEVNTIPGFTTISMYSKMWAASGLDYSALLDRLIELALERHAEKQQHRSLER